MEKIIVELMGSGMFSILDLLLIAVIGIMAYFLIAKMKCSESYVNTTIEGMRSLLEEERKQTEALSKTVYTIRKEINNEKEKNFALREEIIILKQENIRLQNVVTQMEELIKEYKQQIEELREELQKERERNKNG